MKTPEDKVWFDVDRKLEGIRRDILEAKAGGSNALILAHFKSTLEVVEASLRARSIEYLIWLRVEN